MVWDPETETELIATATYLTTYNDTSLSDTDTYVTNGMSAIESLTASSSVTQNINLPFGWSFWSTYVHPQEDANMQSVVSNISSDVAIVKNWAGDVYWPVFNINTIGDLNRGEGYQIKMETENVLTIEGDLTP